MGFEVSGLEEFRASFRRLRDKGPQTVSDTVRRHMEEEVFPATQQLVPRDTGALADTGRVERGEVPHEYAVVYGDSSVENDEMVDYAAAVHEIEDHRHDPPTSAKFVERPLKESVPKLADRAAKALEDLARG